MSNLIFVGQTTCPNCHFPTNGSLCLDCQAERIEATEALLALDIEIPPADDREMDEIDWEMEMGF